MDIIHYLRMKLEEGIYLLRTFKKKKIRKEVILVPVGIYFVGIVFYSIDIV